MCSENTAKSRNYETLDIFTMLSLKLHLGHRRKEDNIAKQIDFNEKNTMFQCGFNDNTLRIKS